MPIVKTALRQLSDIDVGFISLVDRGANRIPFRIVKRHQDGTQQEIPMLDLAKLGVKKAETKTVPTVTAVILKASTEPIALQVQALLKAEGLDFSHLIKGEEGTFTLAADETFDKGATAVEVGKDIVAVLKAFDPYCTPLKDMSFAEAASARGFYSSIDSASRTYSDAVYTQLYEASSPSDAAAEIKKLSTEFTQYVSTMVAGLPAKVFKMDKMVTTAKESVVKADKEAADAKAVADAAALKKADDDAKAAEAAAAAAKTAESTKEGEQVQKEEAPKPSPEIAALLEAVKGLTTTVQKSAEEVMALRSGQEKLEKSVAEIDQKARSADSAVQVMKNTVVGSDNGGDTQVQQAKAVKKNDDPYTGVFDTGMMSRRH